MLIAILSWLFLVSVSSVVTGLRGKAHWTQLLLELPLLVGLFFISKGAFTYWMLESGVPRRDIVIEGELYLRRWFLSPRTWRYKLFLHDIRKGDTNRDPHNHPWPFRTLTLSGGYDETTFYPGGHRETFKRTRFGTYAHHKATHVHKISLYSKSPTWTLVLAGPGERSWGFWIMGQYCYEDRFVDHKDYLGLGEEHDHVEDRLQVRR